jgi:chaperonin cofactor prefoldin
MPSIAPVARVAFIGEAVAQLQRLQREMTRLAPRDQNYETNRRAIQAAILELRKMISNNVQ